MRRITRLAAAMALLMLAVLSITGLGAQPAAAQGGEVIEAENIACPLADEANDICVTFAPEIGNGFRRGTERIVYGPAVYDCSSDSLVFGAWVPLLEDDNEFFTIDELGIRVNVPDNTDAVDPNPMVARFSTRPGNGTYAINQGGIESFIGFDGSPSFTVNCSSTTTTAVAGDDGTEGSTTAPTATGSPTTTTAPANDQQAQLEQLMTLLELIANGTVELPPELEERFGQAAVSILTRDPEGGGLNQLEVMILSTMSELANEDNSQFNDAVERAVSPAVRQALFVDGDPNEGFLPPIEDDLPKTPNGGGGGGGLPTSAVVVLMLVQLVIGGAIFAYVWGKNRNRKDDHAKLASRVTTLEGGGTT